MNKETIGKVQLWIGIVLLIVGIVGIVLSGIIIKNELKNANYLFINQDISETGMILEGEKMSTYILAGFIIGATSILTIFISWLFITQGLANKAEN